MFILIVFASLLHDSSSLACLSQRIQLCKLADSEAEQTNTSDNFLGWK